jgi:hypothetical protein
MDADGAIRVRGTRVTLDSIVAAFRAGATAEENEKINCDLVRGAARAARQLA